MIRLHHLKMASRFLIYRFRKFHPFEVQANLLNACNLRCVYCRCPEVETPLMTTEQWLTIIRSLRRMGTIRIKFQGGEPTLYPDFRELCRETKRLGMISAVITNGLPIASQPSLLDYLDELVVSWDSTHRETNDRLRGKGAFEGAKRAIELGLERGLKTYSNMLLTSENFEHFDEMLAYCEGRGVKMNAQPVMYNQKSIYGEYFDDTVKQVALTNEQIKSLHKRLAEEKRQGRKLLFSSLSYQKAADWEDYTTSTVQKPGDSPCMAGKYYFHIEPNGDVLPCALNESSFIPKNILKDGLKEAMSHAKHHNCWDCWMVYMNERKVVFGLKPEALLEIFRRG
ncbi:radical SAM/SPASM domain-containing protein [Acidobacteriota bacterium]